MNSQIEPQSRLPFGIDLDDDITVILYKSGPVKIMKYIGVGEQEEIIISAEGVAKLIAWLNKHATQQLRALDLPHGGSLCEVVVDEEGGTKIYPIESANQ